MNLGCGGGLEGETKLLVLAGFSWETCRGGIADLGPTGPKGPGQVPTNIHKQVQVGSDISAL